MASIPLANVATASAVAFSADGNIDYFGPSDPVYFDVDNRPLTNLAYRDVLLRDAINNAINFLNSLDDPTGAAEVGFDNTGPGIPGSPSDVQAAIEQVWANVSSSSHPAAFSSGTEIAVDGPTQDITANVGSAAGTLAAGDDTRFHTSTPDASNADHDGRYYTESEIGAVVAGSDGASLVGLDVSTFSVITQTDVAGAMSEIDTAIQNSALVQFDAVVPDTHATPKAAVDAGKTRIFVKAGSYDDSGGGGVWPSAATMIIGENRRSVLWRFDSMNTNHSLVLHELTVGDGTNADSQIVLTGGASATHFITNVAFYNPLVPVVTGKSSDWAAIVWDGGTDGDLLVIENVSLGLSTLSAVTSGFDCPATLLASDFTSTERLGLRGQLIVRNVRATAAGRVSAGGVEDKCYLIDLCNREGSMQWSGGLWGIHHTLIESVHVEGNWRMLNARPVGNDQNTTDPDEYQTVNTFIVRNCRGDYSDFGNTINGSTTEFSLQQGLWLIELHGVGDDPYTADTKRFDINQTCEIIIEGNVVTFESIATDNEDGGLLTLGADTTLGLGSAYDEGFADITVRNNQVNGPKDEPTRAYIVKHNPADPANTDPNFVRIVIENNKGHRIMLAGIVTGEAVTVANNVLVSANLAEVYVEVPNVAGGLLRNLSIVGNRINGDAYSAIRLVGAHADACYENAIIATNELYADGNSDISAYIEVEQVKQASISRNVLTGSPDTTRVEVAGYAYDTLVQGNIVTHVQTAPFAPERLTHCYAYISSASEGCEGLVFEGNIGRTLNDGEDALSNPTQAAGFLFRADVSLPAGDVDVWVADNRVYVEHLESTGTAHLAYAWDNASTGGRSLSATEIIFADHAVSLTAGGGTGNFGSASGTWSPNTHGANAVQAK